MTAKLLFLLLSSSLVVSQDDPFVSTIEKVKNAVVPIVCGARQSDGKMTAKHVFGTGFFINQLGVFITADHVIAHNFSWDAEDNPTGDCIPILLLPVGGWTRTLEHGADFVQFKPCSTNEELDIAVCYAGVNPFGNTKYRLSYLPIRPTIPKDGTLIAFSGFPFGIQIPSSFRASIAVASPSKIIINNAAFGGNSGGPVYLLDGSAIGFVSQAGTDNAMGLTWARPFSEMMDFFRKNKVLLPQDLN